jgi:hypothetical protein
MIGRYHTIPGITASIPATENSEPHFVNHASPWIDGMDFTRGGRILPD